MENKLTTSLYDDGTLDTVIMVSDGKINKFFRFTFTDDDSACSRGDQIDACRKCAEEDWFLSL